MATTFPMLCVVAFTLTVSSTITQAFKLDAEKVCHPNVYNATKRTRADTVTLGEIEFDQITSLEHINVDVKGSRFSYVGKTVFKDHKEGTTVMDIHFIQIKDVAYDIHDATKECAIIPIKPIAQYCLPDYAERTGPTTIGKVSAYQYEWPVPIPLNTSEYTYFVAENGDPLLETTFDRSIEAKHNVNLQTIIFTDVTHSVDASSFEIPSFCKQSNTSKFDVNKYRNIPGFRNFVNLP